MSGVFTCPWCGTTHLEFQSNCSNCGGPMLAPRQQAMATATEGDLPNPPPAPRSISSRYVWRLLSSDAWSVVAGIFGILGLVFTLVGSGLTVAVITAFVGLPFLLLGLCFLAFSIPVFIWRYRNAQKIMRVLREGAVTQGEITAADEQYSVRVNGRHPWIVRYRFAVEGKTYEGKVSTLNPPGAAVSAGRPARILYLSDAPQWNSIYPHP